MTIMFLHLEIYPEDYNENIKCYTFYYLVVSKTRYPRGNLYDFEAFLENNTTGIVFNMYLQARAVINVL